MSQFDSHAQPVEARLAQVGVDGRVAAEEVLFLRRQVFADGVVSERELDALFALGKRAPDGDPEWAQFFAEAVADFYLREEEPQGYLTADEFDELQARIIGEAHANPLEIALLVKLMETAVQTPPEMSAFVGSEIKASIMAKDRPSVSKEEALLIRRWLFAAGGDGYVGVTQREAEVLFDINDALRTGESNAAWTELFIQGVVNHLMASLGYSAASRDEAMRRHAFISDHSSDVGGFFQKMLSGVASAFSSADEKTAYADKAQQRETAVAQAATVTPEEAEWLAGRIGRDGAFDANERQLIERMKDLEENLPDSLKALLERAA